MKRILYILFAASLVLMGCTRRELDIEIPKSVSLPGADSTMRVLVQFNVSIPELTPQTKALGDTPSGDLDNIYLAVFGRSGYLKEYVEATITPATTNGKVGETTNRYTISATLALSENSERHIHFIGNGPESMEYDQETELIPNLLSPAGKGGYWQYVSLPGIKAKRDENDEDHDGDTEEFIIRDGNYVIADETAAYFQDVPLIRNFSKIVVEDLTGCHFSTISFAAVNVATQGSIAPYYSGGFVKDYQLKGYADLRNTLQYPALLPSSVSFDESVPTASAFESNPVGSGVVPAGSSYFLYERPVPDDEQKPTSVIIYGTFTDPDTSDGDESGNYYYKIDLSDNDGYYPIYRNFKYRIQIQEILRPGADTPEEAIRSMGSGDISADVATQSLTDISDGTSHILVSYMSKTLIRQYPYTEGNVTEQLTLLYKYVPDVNADTNNDGQADWNNDLVANGGPVTITLQTGLASPVINSYTVAGSDDANGFRTITITTNAPSGNLRTQYLRVSGTHTNTDGKKSTLFRNVTYSMINTQTMTVTCTPKRVPRNPGEEIRVDIIIPKDLPPSMFPLIFNLEAVSLSLTPDNSKPNNNLPVNSSNSLTGSGKPAFHFIRTVSESEYQSLSAASATTTVTIPCYFKTNTAESASDIYVTDEGGYFLPGTSLFKNYGVKTFTDLNFPNGVPRTVSGLAPFTFLMDNTDDLPEKVYLKFENVRPIANSGLTAITDPNDEHYGWYWYAPATTTNSDLQTGSRYHPTIQLATTNTSGKAKVWIEADEYNPAYYKYSVPATSISISPSTQQTLTLNSDNPNDDTVDITATVSPDNTTDVLYWTSSNTSVAIVDQNGHVTAVAPGTTTITVTARDAEATSGGVSASVQIKVRRRYWTTGTYSISFTDYSNADAAENGEISDSSRGITVQFENCSQQHDGMVIWRNYRLDVGTNNSDGTIFVSVNSNSPLEGCRLSSATFTYFKSGNTTYNSKNVTSTPGTMSGKTSWSASSSGEGNGDTSVTFTMGKGNPHNSITNLTINYGYYAYQE